MKQSEVQNVVEYWIKTAQHDFDTMRALFKIKRYSDCLFFGHIVLEKLLKAHVVRNTKEQAPFLHDLVRLKELADVLLTDEEVALLNKINDFNIRSRYPEYKLTFYTLCTKAYVQGYLNQIVALYKKLCRTLKQK